MIVIFHSAVGFLMGVVMWVLGARGRRVDDHVHCRECGYDLTGLPGMSRRCSECGADVRVAGATFTGPRVAWPRVKRLGMLMALVAGVVLAHGVHGWWRTFDGMAWKPFFMVRQEFHSADDQVRGRARNEIERRLARRLVTPAQGRALVEDVMAWQRDGAATWNPEWSGVIFGSAGAWEAAGVPRPEIEKLLGGSLKFSCRVRPRVEWGTVLPLEVRMGCLQAESTFFGPSIWDLGYMIVGRLTEIRPRVMIAGQTFEAVAIEELW